MREVLPSTSPTTKLSCAITHRSWRGWVNGFPYFLRRGADLTAFFSRFFELVLAGGRADF